MKKLNSALLIIIPFLVLAGCEQQQKKTASQKILTKPDIKLSVVAQYVRNDSSKYITQQKYEIYSDPQSILISSVEPYGNVVWSVQNGIYTEPKNKKFYDSELFSFMTNKDITQGVMELYLAGLEKVRIQDVGQTLDFNGQVYECVAKNEQNVKLFKNKKTGKLDLVTSGQDSKGQFFIIYGYNYEKMGKNNEKSDFYATKVDIYLYKAAYDKKLLAQLNCSLN
ncbi:MAG: hypothetical protein LLF92_03530 [Planctomycetaceae bacterium]|nr:hypothetical protein [Planctomycetaceae bacterium]